MDLVQQIKESAKAEKKHIVLPEGADARVVEAAATIQKEGIAQVTLLGTEQEISAHAAALGLDLTGVNCVDPVKSPSLTKYVDAFFQLRKAKGVTLEQALEAVKTPMYFGAMMLHFDEVDGLVGGALCTTADTLRPGLQIIKTAPGVKTVSSSFVMMVPDCAFGDAGAFIFADCAINIDPTAEQLADIAIASAATGRSLVGMEPKVAMLSYSTKGSGAGPQVDKVVEAVKILHEKAPDLDADGELQADAALVEKVGQLKSPGSKVAGHANVLIFPDIQSGNIGYKLVQRLAKAEAVGPVCQGFAKPINDLSRGCSVEDIVNVTAITVLQAAK